MTVTWGTVMWLFRCFCQIVMHTAFFRSLRPQAL
ncbi:hypothetical protein QW131_05105 [Roseibium salinum]|nr:hypothetical protein [Roseibium salinum]